MKTANYAITNFEVVPPRFTITQQATFDWILAAHVKAESVSNNLTLNEKEIFEINLKEKLYHVGCKPGIIDKRGHSIPDFQHHNWKEMHVYSLENTPQGVSLQSRQAIHKQIVDEAFEKFYPNDSVPPDHLLHVSCTGYTSPSGAQALVANRNWTEHAIITHLYHTGCYASIPAIRIALGQINHTRQRADVVHTELCSLHMNPLLHDANQLVSQSLFGDGFIKYSVTHELDAEKSTLPFLKILATHEQIIPDTLKSMSWILTDWGFQFLLTKEIPVLIAKSLYGFLTNLCHKADIDIDELLSQAIFAVHPGGPKIIEFIKKLLKLQENQLRTSRIVLQQHGNMSSATLPHIWQAICLDSSISSFKKIVSIAFGPGLTIAGAILEKRG